MIDPLVNIVNLDYNNQRIRTWEGDRLAPDDDYSAREAAEALGVTLPTLYAYVSRGLLRSLEGAASTRARRYPRADVEALRRKREQRGDPGPIAEGALSWGTPVLSSAITANADGRLFYRGREAVALAQTWPFERVAMWLWTGVEGAPWPGVPGAWPEGRLVTLRAQLADLDATAACQALLPVAAAADPAAWDLRPAAVTRTGARILHVMALLMAGASAGPPASGSGGAPATSPAAPGDGFAEGAIAARLAAAWAGGRAEAREGIEAALILAADHELNVSAFAARCAASAAATPYDVVLAGLATLRGARHGGHTERVAALLDEVGEPARAPGVLAARLRRGEAIAGFGQPLYPAGDPRGAALLALAARLAPQAAAVDLGRAVAAAGEAVLNERPTIDFGLVVLARALGLPSEAPLALFALGRAAGWLAHALEQYEGGALIRPRARYVGVAPGSGAQPLAGDAPPGVD